jgi:BarA-like signal transduction histidine kinase
MLYRPVSVDDPDKINRPARLLLVEENATLAGCTARTLDDTGSPLESVIVGATTTAEPGGEDSM